MSLIIWMDFWDWDGNSNSLSATTMTLSPILAGTARGRNTTENTYQMLPDDYWDERESRLHADPPKADPSVPKGDETQAAPPPAPKTDSERSGLLESMRNASSLDELKSISAQLRS